MENFKDFQPETSSESEPTAQEQFKELAFPETPKMQELHGPLVDALLADIERRKNETGDEPVEYDSASVKLLADQYHRLAEAETDPESEAYPSDQLKIMFRIASLRLEAGDFGKCYDELLGDEESNGTNGIMTFVESMGGDPQYVYDLANLVADLAGPIDSEN